MDSAWEQKKLEARKMLVNRADAAAASACLVGQTWITELLFRLTPYFPHGILMATPLEIASPARRPPNWRSGFFLRGVGNGKSNLIY